MNEMTTYVGLLRGINVGGHHKVPMPALRGRISQLGATQVRTILNTGNVLFEIDQTDSQQLEQRIESDLSEAFGFKIPVILRTKSDLYELVQMQPFQAVTVHADIRLYVSFLKNEPAASISLPYVSQDQAYQIVSVRNRIICSVLDLSVTKTPKGMDELEAIFGKNITTRNWNTVLKIADA